MAPTLYFGGGTVGEGQFSTPSTVTTLLSVLHKDGIVHIDTAPVYPGSAPGSSEHLFGAAGAATQGFTLCTKIKVTGEGPGKGSLTEEAIERSLKGSLNALGVDEVDTLYCHIPDTATPIAVTAEAFHRHWSSGKFKRLGISNYTPSQVTEFLSTCSENNWVKPTVFQGQYNALCRGIEKTPLPLLRQHNIAFVAFSPLAGGFLTGNFSLGGDLAGTRFEEGSAMGAHYRPMYDKEGMHAAVRDLHTFLQPRGLSLAGASLRWLAYHSALRATDGIILGATKTEQIEENVREIGKGPLDEGVVEAFERAWEGVRDGAP